MSVKLVIVVTGSRHLRSDNCAKITEQIARKLSPKMDFTLIHGGAPGADTLIADHFSSMESVHVVKVLANWQKHGKCAGPKRNLEMLELAANFTPESLWILGFPMIGQSNNGTRHCLKSAIDHPANFQVFVRPVSV